MSELGSMELQDLETRLGLEKAAPAVMPSYDPVEKLLIVLLPGQPLASAHFLSLPVRDFLQRASLLEGNVTVASFPECASPDPEAFAEMIAMTQSQETAEQELQVYCPLGGLNGAPSIVMIDQNADLLDFMQARLGMQGYDVLPAQDGLEGLHLIREASPDLVITELTLPALDGYQLIHRIRQSRELNRSCKIMVLTDLGLDREVSKCFDLGVSDVIRKPFSPVELEARIRRLLA
ncbi:response regulator transcription factor [Paenibacillus konkukensis]|nr:response regulator [Paenibacillus konkukensis]